MRIFIFCATLLTGVFTLRGFPAGDEFTQEEKARVAASIKAEFLRSWQAYKKYAWGHDGIRPISKTPYDWYGEPLMMTPVDALDTMVLMGLTGEADTVREYIARNLRFDKDMYVKNFEITIRLLGGLISGYQLTGDARLLALARDLGDRLLPVFNPATGLPYSDVNLKTGAVRGIRTNPCEAGSLLLEFGTLSKLTGNPVYYEKAKRSFRKVYERRSPIGLVGSQIDCETGRWTAAESHIGACIDSYYEYMVKCARLFGDGECLEMWDHSIIALNRYLADSAAGGLWYGRADMNSGKRTKRWFGELEAFFPAVLVLAGDVERARALQESSLAMWTRYGVEPEQFDYASGTAVAPRFFLGPEIGESAYYLYRATGEGRYLRMGKIIFDSMITYCRTEGGFAELKDVVTKEKSDRTETYFFAETLKYLYLLFAAPETLEFDKVTFNTEAHPIRRTWP